MKTPRHPQASVLVFALLVLVAGCLVLGGLAQLAATHAIVGSREWEEANQRIVLGNSRAMARQFVLARMFQGTVPTNAFALAAPGGIGGFTISNGIANYWTASTAASGALVNAFSPFERGGFYPTVLSATLSDGTTNAVPWSFQVRTRSPIAAGFGYVAQASGADRSAPRLTASKWIELSNSAARFNGYEAMPALPVSSVTNTNRDATGYVGYLAPPEPGVGTDFPSVTLTNLTATNAEFTVNLLRDPGTTNGAFRCVVPTADGAGRPVTSVVLQGAPTGEGSAPLLIVIPAANANVTSIRLLNSNRRRVYLVRQPDTAGALPNITVSCDAASWRLGMTVAMGPKYFPAVTFSNLSGFYLSGGLRTDAAVQAAVMPAMVSETDPAGLDYVGDAMMWLEDRRTP